MVTLEFYTSALTIEAIFYKTPTTLLRQKKTIIFFTSTSIYVILELILCFVDYRNSMTKTDVVRYYNLPIIGLFLFDVISTILLSKVIRKQR